METATYRVGEVTRLPFFLRQDSGEPVNLIGSTAWASIQTGAECRVLHGSISEPLTGLIEIDIDNLDLPPRLYRATLWVLWSNGWQWPVAEFCINIEGGC